MAQFLRPDSNVTQTGFTGGFAEIDEATASNADFAYGANNTAAVLEVGLSNPTGTPGSGTTTVRYRLAKTNAGTVDGAGNAVNVTAEVYQGTTLIATDPTTRTPGGAWTDYSWTPSMASVTDWTALRLRFTTTASGGSPANRRGAGVSWAELEAPDATSAVTGSMAATEGSTLDAFAASGKTVIQGALAATDAGSDTFAASGKTLVQGSAALAESGADAFEAAGTVAVLPVTGDMAAIESGADALAGAGKVIVAGQLAAQETGQDTFSASGGFGAVTGAMAAAESGSDTLAGEGKVIVSGALAATDAGSDAFAASGTLGELPIYGAMDVTEAGSDTFAATGALGEPTVTGVMTAVEAGVDAFTSDGALGEAAFVEEPEQAASRYSGGADDDEPADMHDDEMMRLAMALVVSGALECRL